MITNWFGIFDRKKYRYELSQWWNRKFKEMPAAPTGISYRPGDIILDELPYAASVSSDSISYVCSLCFSSTATELCGGCQKVVYCSEECKESDYRDHYYECCILPAEEELPDEELRLVIRTITRYLAEKGNPTVGDFFGRKRTIDDLLSHVGDLNEEELTSIHLRVDELMTLIENHIDIDYDVAMELLMKCRINSYCVMDHNDPNFYSRGRALYLAASSVDHTCEDTDEYAYMFDGRRFILSCSRCVTDARQPLEERQKRECDEELAAEIDTLFTEQKTMQEWYEGGTEVLKKFGDIPVTDFYHFWVLTRMQVATHEIGHLEESLLLGARGLRGADSVLSMEPIMFYMCSAMAKLGWNKKGSKDYEAFHKGYSLAKKLFTVTHGSKHEILTLLQSFKRETPPSELIADKR
ncbi:histone-lysine N-methyltransferase SMYD3-like isoform X2 [Varroa jacobsoni]|uniref:histone-lysine N-methyltransferase SMYD3-like isoform X2 n=1 Tax=Varroa jacobsoni TaxID=62625 RepID=UPI000BFA8975|nr:histone-lysine N-methyltransferase SMYD3-like isoform X2 [Varroa jacobsoni]